MSNIVSAIVQRRRIGSATKKAILLYMADRASDDGSGVWTSKGHIAADLELTIRAVRKNIGEMVRDGILIEAGTKKCRHGHTIEYALDVARIEALESTRNDAGMTREQGSPRNHVPPYPGTTFPPTPEPRSYKPSLEPSLEPPIKAVSGKMDGFDGFWEKLPKGFKNGKAAAEKAWRNMPASQKNGAIENCEAYFKWWKEQHKDASPLHPSTYLNQRRWQDEAFTTRAQSQSKGGDEARWAKIAGGHQC